jgi:hypothetical protein
MPILQAGDIKFVIYEMIRESSDVNIPEMLATDLPVSHNEDLIFPG